MAETTPNRRKRRRAGVPWSALLFALLLLFWKFVGGAGGLFPGTGKGTETNERAQSRPAGSKPAGRETTVRLAQLASPGPSSPTSAPPPPGKRRARVKVAPPRDAAGGGHDVTVSMVDDGHLMPGRGRLEVLPESRPGNQRLQASEAPIVDGRATIPGVPRGSVVRVRMQPEGGPEVAETFTVEQGEREIDLTGDAHITGRAAFADAGPVGDQGFTARLFRAAHQEVTKPMRTEADGSFRLDVPAGRDVVLELMPEGAVKGADVAPVVFQRDALEAGSTWDLGPGPVTFEREALIAEGVVVDRSGSPVANAGVLALPIGLEMRALTARTDAAGHFAVMGPPGIGDFDLFASTESEAAPLPGEATHRGAAGLRLVLAPAGRIQGAIAGSPTPALNPHYRVELQTAGENLFLATHVLSDGTFEFPHVPAGTSWRVQVVPPEGHGAGVLRHVVVPEGGSSGDPGLKAMTVPTRFEKRLMRLIDASGAPIAGAAVEVTLTPTATLRVRADAAGVAEVAAPPDAQVPIVVAAPEFAPHHASWDGRSAITLALRPPESAESR